MITRDEYIQLLRAYDQTQAVNNNLRLGQFLILQLRKRIPELIDPVVFYCIDNNYAREMFEERYVK